jgi:hypothetical protein
MDLRDIVTRSSKEQMRSPIRVQMQGEITRKGGKDQGVTIEHPWGLERKDWTSCKKTPYLKCRNDVTKMMQGVKVQNDERTHMEEGASEPG